MTFGLISLLSNKITKAVGKKRFLGFTKVAAVLSIVIGTIALILSMAILEGFSNALNEKAISFTSHISLRSFNRDTLTDYQNNIEKIKLKFKDEITAIQPIVEREALIRTRKYVEGVILRGIYNNEDITGIQKFLSEGTFHFSSDSAKEIVLGGRLANKLAVSIGDLVTLYFLDTQTAEDIINPRITQFTVKGIYNSGMQQYDDILLFIPQGTARRFFEISETSITSYEIMLKDITKANKLALEIEDYLAYPHYALTVFDLHYAIFTWIELQKEPIPIVLGLITIVAVLNIVTTLLITVVEKTNTIGILRTLGLSSKKIIWIFILKGLRLGFTGTLIGGTIGYSFCYLQSKLQIIKLNSEIYFLDYLPIHFEAEQFLIIAILTMGFSFLASLIPALVVVKISPLKVIRFK